MDDRVAPETGCRAKSAPPPVRVTVCGLPGALSEMLSEPLRVPATVGVKVIVNVQDALAATLAPQLLVCEKSPDTEALVMESDALPVFLSVTVCDALEELTSCVAKVRAPGETLGIGPLDVTVSVAVAVLLGPARGCVIEKLVVKVPRLGAFTNRLKVHEAPPASGDPVTVRLVRSWAAVGICI